MVDPPSSSEALGGGGWGEGWGLEGAGTGESIVPPLAWLWHTNSLRAHRCSSILSMFACRSSAIVMVYDSTALQLSLQAKPLCLLLPPLAELELSSVSKLSYRRDKLEIAPQISIDAELDPSFAAMSVSGSELRKSHTSPPECREGRHSSRQTQSSPSWCRSWP